MGHICDYFNRRIQKENKNVLGCFVGPTGSGKSYGALYLGEKLDPDFNIDNVCFDFGEMLKLMDSGKLKRGSFVMMDEAGISLGARNWYSSMNKTCNYILQSFRKFGYVTFFTVPNFDFLDKQTRFLMHAMFVTNGIDYRRKLLTIKPLFLQVNAHSGKCYTKYLRVRDKENGGLDKVSKISLGLPSQELQDKYEAKKVRFLGRLRATINRTQQQGNKKSMVGQGVKCKRCGNSWRSKSVGLPKRCPKCMSRVWNRPKSEDFPRQNALTQHPITNSSYGSPHNEQK